MTNKASESNQQFIAAWRYWASHSPAGEITIKDGIAAPWMMQTWPICNLTFLSKPVTEKTDLNQRIETALALAEPHPLGWIFFVSPDLLAPELRDEMDAVFGQYSLAAGFTMTGMETEKLLSPQHKLPKLKLKPVADEKTRSEVGELNCLGYEMPVEWGIEALNVPALWRTPPAYGYVGYVDDQPVSCAKTVILDSCLYVGLVATHPEHRRKGYAEAVMRHSIAKAQQESGQQKIVLHATEQGQSLYQAMGFEMITPFYGFMLPH